MRRNDSSEARHELLRCPEILGPALYCSVRNLLMSAFWSSMYSWTLRTSSRDALEGGDALWVSSAMTFHASPWPLGANVQNVNRVLKLVRHFHLPVSTRH